ncbi:hypothetical protein EBB07_06055 [Paenibacillaceae bacterium]|nr:hypothetical protein EBB07_06055 [Paenibacillaceae bacterium]
MKIDRLQSFLGLPHKLDHNICLYSPRVSEIVEAGEVDYLVYLLLTSFNKEKILQNLFNLSEAEMETLAPYPDYEVLTEHPAIRAHICQAFSFFTKVEVTFDHINHAFNANGHVFIHRDNYRDLSCIVDELNGIDRKEDSLRFKNNKAREIFDKLSKLRAKQKKTTNDALEFKDILSILCHAEGNGLNIFNIQQLTIYQVYEHFERLNLKESHNRILPVWANGHLKENDKLPEWIVKTKM